ncbi:hypothetical protein BJX64DRAFT_249515 [Aspergillus heterothallicus]
MKGSLNPAYLLYLRRNNFGCPLPATARIPFSRPPWIQPCRLSQWNRPFSAAVKFSAIEPEILEEYFRFGVGKNPKIPSWELKSPRAWITLLEKHLSHASQNGNADTSSHPALDRQSESARESFIQAIDLVHLLYHARINLRLDLLAHLGFKFNNWTAVYTLLGTLLDTMGALKDVSTLPQKGVVDELAHDARLSLDQLTDQPLLSFSSPGAKNTDAASPARSTGLDELTRMPFAQYHQRRIMAEVLKSLGAIVLTAADASPRESKLAMTYVHRIIARLHHIGAISERVYRYTKPDRYQATIRPPGMHLLSVQILDTLSNEAWLMHQAEVTAKAAAAGQDSPYISLKPNLKELGHEIWIEFILWCCVEGGHIEEGIWLVEQILMRKGEFAWKFQDWESLLQDEESLRKMKIDKEVSWHHGTDSTRAPWRRKIAKPPTFHGLGKRVISMEIISSLLDNISNVMYMGIGSRGLRVGTLIRHINRLKPAMFPSGQESSQLPTVKEMNWLTVRVMESGGLDPKHDPQALDEFLRAVSCLIPPWSGDMCPVDEWSLAQLRPSQLYDDTSALAGLVEYTLRYYCSKRLLGDASNMFAMLQEVTDSSKLRRIDEFFSARMGFFDEETLSKHELQVPPLRMFESSIPHISIVTLADLLDLITACRAFKFGEWLLFSDDIDGPVIPASAYRDQALAPSILRFAGATQNRDLGESVTASLQPPLSLNTLRALFNYRIEMHQWESVSSLLHYMHNHRTMSWAHSNIAALAAKIIRLENTTEKQNPDVERHLSQATRILRRILSGKFNEKHHFRGQYQDRTLLSFALLFSHIPSPSLRDLSHSCNGQLSSQLNGMYIPPAPFHAILSAIVETRGSSAGQNFYKRFCVNYDRPELRRIRAGGISQLYQSHEIIRETGDVKFDFEYHNHARKKLVHRPNPNTVRIIAQKAVKEYEEACAAENEGIDTALPEDENPAMDIVVPASRTSDHDFSHPVVTSESTYSTAAVLAARKLQAEAILFSCIQRFELMGMSGRQITREVGGLIFWKYKQIEHEREENTPGNKRGAMRKWRRFYSPVAPSVPDGQRSKSTP